jgi:hypothetical protein
MSTEENSSIESLKQRQDRAQMMSLLREQEMLVQMEEMRSKQELQEFMADLEHERKMKEVMRQTDIDRLWGHIEERKREESIRRRVEELRLMRDAHSIQLEISSLKTEIGKKREAKDKLREEIVENQEQGEMSLSDSIQERDDALASTGLATAEWVLMSRLEERLQTLLESMEEVALLPDPTAPAKESRLPPSLDINVPPVKFYPKAIVVASKGVSRLQGYPPHPGMPITQLPGYGSSTRCLTVTQHPDGTVPILLAGHRRGVSHLETKKATIIAEYPLGKARRYAVNASGFLENGMLMGTHSEMGVLLWREAEKPPTTLDDTIKTARLLRILPGGRAAIFASEDKLYRYNHLEQEHEMIMSLAGRTITSMDIAGRLAVIGDAKGSVTILDIDNPNQQVAPMMVGEKVYTVGVLDWRGTTWVAAGVKRKTGIYVILEDLRGELPGMILNVPERIHTLRRGGPGTLVAASERFLSFWNLGESHQSRIISVAPVAPIQDFALVPF